MVKILIVEDDAAIREAFSIILKLHDDYDVAVAENGLAALQLCQEVMYDVILLDIMMPVMDGPTFLKEYSNRYAFDLAKVIIMSNLSSGSELSLVQDLGVERFVLKSSLTPQRLMAIVAEVLKERNQLQNKLDTSDPPHTRPDTDVRGTADETS